MINKIHLYDQALSFIRQDARFTTVQDSGLKNIYGGDKVNAWEILAHEFENYWRCIIAEEVAKAFNIDVEKPDVLLLTIWKNNDRPK